MATVRWNFPNGNNGDTLTAPLAGADTINMAGATADISTAQAIIGTKSAHMVGTVTGHAWFAKESLSTTTVAADMYLYIAAELSASFNIIWCGSSSSVRSVGVRIQANRELQLVNSAGTTLWASSIVPMATWVRISLYATINATTGTAVCEWYNGHDTSAQSSSGMLTNVNTGSTVDRIRVGLKSTSVSGTGEIHIGSWAYDTAAAGLIPPYSTGTSVNWRRRDTGVWTPVSPRERDSGSWSARSTVVK